MNRLKSWLARHQIGTFVALSIALSWWPWPLALVNPESTAMLPFGPAVAAVLVTATVGGREALSSLLRAVLQWRVHWSMYVAAGAGPFIVAGLAGGVAVASGVLDASRAGDALGWSTWLGLPVLIVTTAVLGGPLFEEIGWRGFLLPKLQKRHTPLLSTAVAGAVWAAWHLPLLITEPTGQRPALPFTVWLLGQAVLLTWLYNATKGSLLIAILFHTSVNTAGRLLLEPFVGQDGFLTIWWLMAALYAVAAGIVTWRTRGRLGMGDSAGPHPAQPIMGRRDSGAAPHERSVAPDNTGRTVHPTTTRRSS